MLQSERAHQPLSEEELNMLEAFLASADSPEECMNSLEMIDGYLTAIVIGPEVVPEHRWIKYMLDPENLRENLFNSPEDEARITDLLNRHVNAIDAQFESDPEGFLPIYEMFSYSEEEERQIAIEEWALGFILGMELSHEAWQPLFSDESTAMLAGPLFVLGKVTEDYDTMSQEEKDQMVDMLDESIIGIYAFWQQQTEGEKGE
ncbi:YecA family protein [Chlorobaculum sp. MV4-Y]|uniref:YecA/YgfB family protein n=1 Tax=Chlorobaculum sp. MV4-Y TaxID=2976335 RepID=UPI0021AF9D93|nr:YecA family protein [Chlorobaculum sp. MV4-Y]UWX58524.1 YecA family protein [Chlorobaculum sp. MV4-Y]